MGLPRGTMLDSVEILDSIGSGGMGEVYRGRDTKLGRDVAVKMLPEAFAKDPDRVVRIEREAQALAALNHPNIAVIHDLKEVNGSKYLILELVDGDTLAERIGRGPIPMEEALSIARQIAQALEAAHEKGIVHRDLKPANVKITTQGRIKVLDFGLAKFYESTTAPQTSANSPTMNLQTGGGVILGTAAYMSPEQARGKSVDRRADIWAFGCVLYEMIAGRQTFPTGETVTDTLAGILARDPDWSGLPAGTSPKVKGLLERCLRKDERRRLRDIGNARIQLEEARNESDARAVAATVPASSRRREYALAGLALVSFLAAAGIGIALFSQPSETVITRFDAAPPANMAGNAGFSLSPDGRKVAHVTMTPAQIWIREFADATAQALTSTEGAAVNFFWSPDSQYIGFFAEGKLKKVPVTGGPATVLTSLPAGGNYYGSWSEAGVILVGSDAEAGGPLLQVPDSSGEAKPATELDKVRMEQSHRYPNFLPDGRHFLYLATGKDGLDARTYVGGLDSKDRQPLEGIASEAKYANGYLVFIRDGALMARPFDAGSRKFVGEPFAVADPFAPRTAQTHPFSVSNTGAFSYRPLAGPTSTARGGTTQLLWRDRSGNPTGQGAGPEGEYFLPELSPDGKSIAFTRGTPAQVWIMDLASGRTDQLTTDAAEHGHPRWSPDGKTIAFDSTRDGVANLYSHVIGVPGADKLVFKSEKSKTLSDWSFDGKYLIYVQDGDIFALPYSADPKSAELTPIPVTKTPAMESLPRISKNGKWVAFVSNERANRSEVYIQTFPQIPGVRYPVSMDGALEPHWGPGDKELHYVLPPPAFAWIAVSVKEMDSSLALGLPELLFRSNQAGGEAGRISSGGGSYSVSADGRFLVQANPNFLAAVRARGNLGLRGNADPTTNPIIGATRGGITVNFNWLGGRGR